MKNKPTGSLTRGIFICASCFLLLAFKSEAQTDSTEKEHWPDMSNPYYFNFDYSRNKCTKSIKFEALKIRLPYRYFTKAFPFTQDSTYDIHISEGEKENSSFSYKAYRLTLHVTFDWDNGSFSKRQQLISSEALAGISAMGITNGRRREVFFEELDSLVDHDDSLRYQIHSILRKKHEDYLLAKTGIDFNVARFLEKVAEVRLIDSDMWIEKPDPKYIRKIIYANDTVTVYSKLLIKVKKEIQLELLALLGKDSELMSNFGAMSYYYDYHLLLSDKDNNYLGRISLSGVMGNRVLLMMTEEYAYSSSSLPYKNCERIDELIASLIKKKK